MALTILQNSLFQNDNEDLKPNENGKNDVSNHISIQPQNAKVYRADVIEFLSTLENESVDLITTDPAYLGMNQHLQLGSGRIIGKYSDKANSGEWFEEFHDTLENYANFLSECFRVLKNNRHIYIMFDSYSLLTLAPLVREYFDVKNLITWDKVNIEMI